VPDYKINLEDKFGSLRPIDVAAEAAAVADEWVNQTLTTVNDSVVLQQVAGFGDKRVRASVHAHV